MSLAGDPHPKRSTHHTGSVVREDWDEEEEDLVIVAPPAAGRGGGGGIPVGITIAYQRHEKGLAGSEERSRYKKKKKTTTTAAATRNSRQTLPQDASASVTTKQTSEVRKSQSFQVFLESAAIYSLCLILPTILAYLYNMYDLWNYQRESVPAPWPDHNDDVESSWWYAYLASSRYYQQLSRTLYPPLADYLCASAAEEATEGSSASSAAASYLWSYVSYVVEKAGVCPVVLGSDWLAHRRQKRSVLSEDVTAYTDVFTIAVCSFLLALIRLCIIRLTVPMKDAATLEAMVRCKSVHLLSSDYDHHHPSVAPTPTGTPLRTLRATIVTPLPEGGTSGAALSMLALPLLRPPHVHDFGNDEYDDERNHTNTNEMVGDHDDERNDNDNHSEMFIGYNIDATTEREEEDGIHSLAVGRPVVVATTSLGGDADRMYQPFVMDHHHSLLLREDDDDDDESWVGTARLVHSRPNTATTGLVAAREEDHETANVANSRTRKNRLYAAPRYATALFRLLHCTVAASIAWYYFHDADFWPWFVGGHGRTANCWDLSGGLTVGGMDSDFDQRNVVLKRYFLWQASYHGHSGTFHVLSLLILMLHPTKHAPCRLRSFRQGSTAYVRSLSQHLLAVALIAVAYIFSSLRRLGAMALFAFDVSSWFLHLLQVCINAPEDSHFWRRYHNVVAPIYWCLVIPSFVATRFLVWPAIWYSATFESQVWLKQLEKTLWPGSAALFRNVLHGLMAILLASTVMYFRRLLNHPHIQKSLHRHNYDRQLGTETERR